jgi:hypothetical protein
VITCGYALVAHSAAQDIQNGSLSIFEVIEEVQAAGFPLLIQRAAFVVRLQRDPGADPQQVELTMRLLLDEEELAQGTIRTDFRDKAIANLVTRLEGLVVTRPGVLSFRMTYAGNEIARYQVRAYLTPAPPQINAG